MKGLWASLVLFALMLGFVIGNAIYVKHVADGLARFANDLKNNESPAALLEELQDFWQKHKKFLGLSVETPSLDSVDRAILSLKSAIETNEPFDIESNRLLLEELSRELERVERLSFENIF